MAGGLTVFLFWIGGSLAATATARFLDPFGDHAWTRLTLDYPQPIEIGQGDNLDISGTLSGILPQEVSVLTRPESSKTKDWERQTVAVGFDDGQQGSFSFPLKNVQRDFRFRVLAGDAESATYLVKVLAPPFLVTGSLEVEIFPPAYSGKTTSEKRKPGSTQPGEGSSSGQAYLEADAGSSFVVRGQADQPLSRVRLEFYQPESVKMLLGPLALAAGGSSLHVPVSLAEDRKSFTVSFRPGAEGRYRLAFENDVGLLGRQYFDVHLKPDPAPTISLERPSQSKDNLAALPTAVMSLHVIAQDPIFGLRSVYLRYQTGRDQSPKIIELFSPKSSAELPALLVGPGIVASQKVRVAPTHLEIKRPLPLKEFTHPDGTPLKDGDVVVLQACADDNDDVTQNKQPGTSEQIEIRIIGPNALKLELNQEQTKIQQQLARANDKQKQAAQQIRDAEQRLKQGEQLSEKERNDITQAQQKQQEVKDLINDEKDGLKPRVERLRETVQQNEQLDDKNLRDKLNQVSRELDRLNKQVFEKLDPALATAVEKSELQDPDTREKRKELMEERAREAERTAQQKSKMAEEREKQAEQAAGSTQKSLQDQAQDLRREAEDQRARAEEARRNAADLNDKSAEHRRAEADERAKEIEKQAEAKNKQAEERQKKADQTSGDEKKRLQAEARDLKKQADQLNRQAEKARQEAEPAFQRELREKLTETRKNQEEIEKTFRELMQELEVGATSREVKTDARRLLEDQKNLQAKLEEFQKQNNVAGKSPEELNQKQNQELENMRDAQQKLEERTKQMLDKMEKLAEERQQQNDEQTAKDLRGSCGSGRAQSPRRYEKGPGSDQEEPAQ